MLCSFGLIEQQNTAIIIKLPDYIDDLLVMGESWVFNFLESILGTMYFAADMIFTADTMDFALCYWYLLDCKVQFRISVTF